MDSQLRMVDMKLMSEGIISVDTYIKELFKDEKNNQLTYIAIKELPKDFDATKSNEVFPEEIRYSYPEKIKGEYYGNRFGHEVISNNVRYLLETGVKTSANTDSSSLYSRLAILSFSLCWLLWIIWSVINVYRYGNLNYKWCMILVLTGIVGYLTYSIIINPNNDNNNKSKNIIFISLFCFTLLILILYYIYREPYKVQGIYRLIFN